jgi:hypothetical protein
MNTLEVVNEELEIKSSFQEITGKLDAIKEQSLALIITSIDQKAEMKQAKETRLEVKRLRVAASKKKDEMKSSLLKRGRAIDAAYSVIEDALKPVEAHLLAQEEFAERYEAKRKAELVANRTATLKELDIDSRFMDLAMMPEELFKQVIEDGKAVKQARAEAAAKAKAEAEAKAKADEEAAIQRKAEEAAQRERDRIENEKLRAQAEADRKAREEAERVLAAERAAAKAKLDAAEAEARKIRLEAESKAKAEREKIEAEAKAKAQLAAAPDIEKLYELAKLVGNIQLPEMATIKGQRAIERIDGLLIELTQYIVEEIDSMKGKSL